MVLRFIDIFSNAIRAWPRLTARSSELQLRAGGAPQSLRRRPISVSTLGRDADRATSTSQAATARVSHEGARPTGRFDLVELAGEVMSTVETP
jgi:hypothetical protein